MDNNLLGGFLGDVMQNSELLTNDEIADLLNMSTVAYDAFEKAYSVYALNADTSHSTNPLQVSAKDLIDARESSLSTEEVNKKLQHIIEVTVNELMAKTTVTKIRNNTIVENCILPPYLEKHITAQDLEDIPDNLRPQLLGDAMVVQTNNKDGAKILLWFYKKYIEATDTKEKIFFYNHFRQGLDILDLEPIIYELLTYDPNSIGKWLPQIVKANCQCNAFKIPDTTFISVPMTLLQMSRLDYLGLTPTTLQIANEYCMKAFNLDINKDYFIKTGTFSSKFDFRNAHIHGEKEVREIGEYLLFLSNQAVTIAGPLSTPAIYGASSNNEWVVREYIPDVENNPCIYKGLPLRTEFRVFVDFDTDEVLGVCQYWDPDLLKRRFSTGNDANSPHNIHDYIIIQKQRELLDERFNANKEIVLHKMMELVPRVDLKGQWSVDILKNGEDFYLIDMGLAANSALVDKIDSKKIRHVEDTRFEELVSRL